MGVERSGTEGTPSPASAHGSTAWHSAAADARADGDDDPEAEHGSSDQAIISSPRGILGNQTATSDFGHFCAEVPNRCTSGHIRTHP